MTRTLSLVATLAVAASLLAATPAASVPDAPDPLAPVSVADDFTFFGSGWGHGIGLSQYGTLGLARKGWGATKIVKHYYTGVAVTKKAPPEPSIRVGLVQAQSKVTLTAVGGPFTFVLQKGKVIATVPAGKTRHVSIVGGKYEITTGTGKVVGDKVWGGKKNDLFAKRNGSRIWVADWGHHIGRGKVAFNITSDTLADVVGSMPVESYVKGVAEVPNSWHKVALRTQAIVARSFAYWRLAVAPRSGCSCDILSTTSDQAYIGHDKETAEQGDRWVDAVNNTKRKVVRHNGNYVYTPYSSSSGGHTEAIQKVWPAASSAAWLKAVCDPEDDVPENPNTTWEETFTAGAVTSALKPYTGDIGTVEKFKNYSRGKSGRVTTVKVVGGQGSKVVDGWDIRTGLGLNDSRFYVNKNFNITGRIRTKYDAIDCKPGKSVSKKISVGGGRYQRFKKGRIYVNDGADTVTWMRGKVLNKYLDVGGHTSDLGLPVKYVGLANGAKGVFDGGEIVCNPGCTVTYD